MAERRVVVLELAPDVELAEAMGALNQAIGDRQVVVYGAIRETADAIMELLRKGGTAHASPRPGVGPPTG